MALSTSITLTVSDYDIKMSRSLKFYKNDALKLIFTINYLGIDNAHGIPQKVLMPLEALSAVLFMETPDGTDSVEAGAVEGNVVTFYLNSEYTQNVGVSRMQIRLFDDDGCAITLPEFPFEIKENIYGGTDVNFKNVVLMDNSGNTIITEDFNQIDVGDVFLYGVEPIESVLYKEINDLELVENLDGTEDLIIQLSDGSTKRTKASEFLSAEVDLTGYATETYVQNKIAEASLSGGTGNVSSDIIKSIVVVDALPEVEVEGVLYLVRGGTSTDTPTTPEEPTVTNLYPNQAKSTTSDGFTITFTGRNVTIDGRNDTASIQCQTNQFDMALEANKTYYLKLTNVSGLFDDSKRVSQSDGMICMVALTVYDSSGTSKNLINWDERDARGIYEKFTFTPSSACVKGKLIIQAKKLTSFSNWTCSIVIAEEGV